MNLLYVLVPKLMVFVTVALARRRVAATLSLKRREGIMCQRRQTLPTFLTTPQGSTLIATLSTYIITLCENHGWFY